MKTRIYAAPAVKGLKTVELFVFSQGAKPNFLPNTWPAA